MFTTSEVSRFQVYKILKQTNIQNSLVDFIIYTYKADVKKKVLTG